MNDTQLLAEVADLIKEEHRLEEAGVDGNADENSMRRIREIEVSLDQCWDLLRRRRARRSAGQDPDDAHERQAATVEQFLQ